MYASLVTAEVMSDPAKDSANSAGSHLGGATSTCSYTGASKGSTLHGIVQYSLDSLCFLETQRIKRILNNSMQCASSLRIFMVSSNTGSLPSRDGLKRVRPLAALE